MKKYKTLHSRIYNGEKSHYVNFDFDNCNTNNGWFVYDDIMWWTCALARAYETFGTSAYLAYSEKSFCRVWYGSKKVGDDGSYADPARFEGQVRRRYVLGVAAHRQPQAPPAWRLPLGMHQLPHRHCRLHPI